MKVVMKTIIGLLVIGCFQTTSASGVALESSHWEDPVDGGNWIHIENKSGAGGPRIESLRWDFATNVLVDFSEDRGAQPAVITDDATGPTFGPQDMAFGQDYFTISFSDFDPEDEEVFEFYFDLDFFDQDDWLVGADRFVGTLLTATFVTPEGSQILQGNYIDAMLVDNSRNTLSISATVPSAVPVPAAVWLFGTALIGFIGVSRRRKVA